MPYLTDKHVVISGGGSGVGAETARCFATAGARVSILGRRLEPLQDIAKTTGACATTCDVTDPDSIAAALDTCRATHGPVHIAIANAGAAPSQPFDRMTAGDFTDSLAVNLTGVFNLWQAVLPDLKQAGGGHLIAIASTAGLKGYPYVSGYCAAKHGVIGLTRALAIELAPHGITTNAICPGFIDTPLLERSIDKIMQATGRTRDQAEASLKRANPQNRFIQTDEVAQTALWLCSPAARSVNGHTLALSGGEI